LKIHLVLSDDWELRGDGSGNMRAIQFDTLKKITDIYDNYGLKGSFNAELLQQFYHKKFGEKHPELLTLYNEWEDIVKQIYKNGHDVQLHLHPQWIDAEYKNNRWVLKSDWDINKHSPETIESIVKQGKSYLENLLRPINENYKCVSHRGGSWAVAPGDHLLSILAQNNIVFDMTIVNGLVSEFPVEIDYRNLEEPFLPYYPQMDDSRKVSTEKSPIIAIPTHSFYSRNIFFPIILQKLRSRSFLKPIIKKFDYYLSPRALPIKDAGYNLDEYNHGREEIKKREEPKLSDRLDTLFEQKLRISDIAHLDFPLFKRMIKDIRKRANKTGWEFVPVVIENHTKNIGNFESIKKFAEYIANASDIEVITHTQLAENLIEGLYPIRVKSE
jgi:hypothetical protein